MADFIPLDSTNPTPPSTPPRLRSPFRSRRSFASQPAHQVTYASPPSSPWGDPEVYKLSFAKRALDAPRKRADARQKHQQGIRVRGKKLFVDKKQNPQVRATPSFEVVFLRASREMHNWGVRTSDDASRKSSPEARPEEYEASGSGEEDDRCSVASDGSETSELDPLIFDTAPSSLCSESAGRSRASSPSGSRSLLRLRADLEPSSVIGTKRSRKKRDEDEAGPDQAPKSSPTGARLMRGSLLLRDQTHQQSLRAPSAAASSSSSGSSRSSRYDQEREEKRARWMAFAGAVDGTEVPTNHELSHGRGASSSPSGPQTNEAYAPEAEDKEDQVKVLDTTSEDMFGESSAFSSRSVKVVMVTPTKSNDATQGTSSPLQPMEVEDDKEVMIVGGTVPFFTSDPIIKSEPAEEAIALDHLTAPGAAHVDHPEQGKSKVSVAHQPVGIRSEEWDDDADDGDAKDEEMVDGEVWVDTPPLDHGSTDDEVGFPITPSDSPPVAPRRSLTRFSDDSALSDESDAQGHDYSCRLILKDGSKEDLVVRAPLKLKTKGRTWNGEGTHPSLAFFEPGVDVSSCLVIEKAVQEEDEEMAHAETNDSEELARRRIVHMLAKEEDFLQLVADIDEGRDDAQFEGTDLAHWKRIVDWLLDVEPDLGGRIPDLSPQTRYRAAVLATLSNLSYVCPSSSARKRLDVAKRLAFASLTVAVKNDVDFNVPLSALPLNRVTLSVGWTGWVVASAAEIETFERITLRAVDHQTSFPIPWDFLEEVFEAVPALKELLAECPGLCEEVLERCSEALLAAVNDQDFVRWRASELAATALHISLDDIVFRRPSLPSSVEKQPSLSPSFLLPGSGWLRRPDNIRERVQLWSELPAGSRVTLEREEVMDDVCDVLSVLAEELEACRQWLM